MTSTTRKRLAWSGIAAVTAGFLILQTFPHLKKDLYNWINPEEEDKEEEEEKEKEEIVPEQKQEPKKSTKETKPVVNRNAESPKQESVASALPGRTARMIIPQQNQWMRVIMVTSLIPLIAYLKSSLQMPHWIVSLQLYQYLVSMMWTLVRLMK